MNTPSLSVILHQASVKRTMQRIGRFKQLSHYQTSNLLIYISLNNIKFYVSQYKYCEKTIAISSNIPNYGNKGNL